MRCPVCGTENYDQNTSFCAGCGAALGVRQAAPAGIGEQQLYQLGQAMYDYTKIQRVPKIGFLPVLIVVLEGAVITPLCIAAAGVYAGAFVGIFITALFALLVGLVYRLRAGSSKRLNTYFAQEGEAGILNEFACAQSFANDQFRLSIRYIFIKNGAVLRLADVCEVQRMIHHYRIIPTGFSLIVKVNDENGKMAFPLCRLRYFGNRAEAEQIADMIISRQNALFNNINRY